jgi:hypothetical protein
MDYNEVYRMAARHLKERYWPKDEQPQDDTFREIIVMAALAHPQDIHRWMKKLLYYTTAEELDIDKLIVSWIRAHPEYKPKPQRRNHR